MKKILICVIGFLIVLSYSFPTIAGLDDGLVAYWSFDNCDARDDSGNMNDGTISGNLKCIDGSEGKALEFDGNSWIDIGKTSVLSSALESQTFSISFWLKPYKKDNINGDDGGRDKGIIVFWDDDTQGGGDRWIKIDEGKISFNGYEDPLVGNYPISSNTWYFIVYISDLNNNKSYLYVNGQLVDSVSEPAYPHTSRTYVSIGAGHHGYIWDWDGIPDGDKFKGILDEIRIYNRVLSEDEILTLYLNSPEIQNEDSYQQGFEAGKEYCRNHPEECGITCECATFDLFTNTLHIPCLDMGKNYWLDLELISSDPVQFKMTDFGEN